MNFASLIGVAVTSIALIYHSETIAYAQTGVDPDRISSVREKLAQVAGVLDTLPATSKKRLSSGAQNLLKLAQGWDEVEGVFEVNRPLGDASVREMRGTLSATAESASIGPAAASFVISNPSTDFLFSVMAGFTQSETSTAWCGNHVVIGFNDSSSFFESVPFGPGGASFSGRSTTVRLARA